MKVQVLLLEPIDKSFTNSEYEGSDTIKISLIDYEGKEVRCSELEINKYSNQKTFPELLIKDIGRTVHDFLYDTPNEDTEPISFLVRNSRSITKIKQFTSILNPDSESDQELKSILDNAIKAVEKL